MILLKKKDVYFIETLLSSSEFKLFVVTSFVTYVLLVSNHSDVVKYVLALMLFFFWKQYVMSVLSGENASSGSAQTISSENENPVVEVQEHFSDDETDNWLKLDKPLYQFAKSLQGITKFDKSIYDNVVKELNVFSKKYYKQVIDEQRNLYSNLTKHRLDIQDLEDSLATIQEKLLSMEFVTTHVTYMKRLKIPEKIDRVRNVLERRIRLLKAKRAMFIDDGL